MWYLRLIKREMNNFRILKCFFLKYKLFIEKNCDLIDLVKKLK